MVPPPKNMVMAKTVVSAPLNGNSFRDNTKAPIKVTEVPIKVPKTV